MNKKNYDLPSEFNSLTKSTNKIKIQFEVLENFLLLLYVQVHYFNLNLTYLKKLKVIFLKLMILKNILFIKNHIKPDLLFTILLNNLSLIL